MKQVSASYIALNKVRWDELFDSEAELIRTMIMVSARFEKRGYKGYAYVNAFTESYKKHKELTPKQMTQLKRISKEIYNCYHNY